MDHQVSIGCLIMAEIRWRDKGGLRCKNSGAKWLIMLAKC